MTILCLFALYVRKGALLAGVSGSNGQAAGIIVVRSGVLPGFGSVCAHNYEFQAVIFCYACGKIFGSKKEEMRADSVEESQPPFACNSTQRKESA